MLRLYLALGALVACIGLLYGAYRHGVSVTDAKWRLAEARAVAKQQATERAKAQAWGRVVTQESNRAELTRRTIETERDAAVRVADGLRADIDLHASRACAAPGVAASSPAEPATCGLLADMLVSLEAQGRAVAEEADRARAAGAACERIADGFTAVARGAAGNGQN